MIIRTEKNSHYTTIANYALNDPKLSLKAKGLWAFIMSKPDDWNINYRGLTTQLKEGKAAILAALKELEETGYLVRGQVRQEGGKFSSTASTLYEKPCTENRCTDNRRTENLRTKVTTEELSTNKDIDDKSSMGAEAPVTYGTPEINRMFAVWATTTGKPIQRLAKRNRLACYSLLKAMGYQKLTERIQLVVDSKPDKFAPVITDFISLELKLDQLEAWQVRHTPAPAVNVGALLYPEKYGKVTT